MGIDIEMFVESDGEPTDLWLPNGWEIREPNEYDKGHGATHAIDTDGARYYGMHYERGPWPIIGGVLMSLFASPNVKRVWYFGDSSMLADGVDPITRDDVLALSTHYMIHGERPYRDPGYRKSLATKNPND